MVDERKRRDYAERFTPNQTKGRDTSNRSPACQEIAEWNHTSLRRLKLREARLKLASWDFNLEVIMVAHQHVAMGLMDLTAYARRHAQFNRETQSPRALCHGQPR